MTFEFAMPSPKMESHRLLFDNLIWMNSEDAAEFLRITANALRVMVCRGKVQAYKLGSRLRFKKSELEQLMIPSAKEELL